MLPAVPPALEKAVIQFELMFARPKFDVEEAIDRTVNSIDRSEKENVISFLENVLNSEYSTEKMKKIWNSLGSGVYIPNDGGVEYLLGRLLARLKQ